MKSTLAEKLRAAFERDAEEVRRRFRTGVGYQAPKYASYAGDLGGPSLPMHTWQKPDDNGQDDDEW